MLPCLLSPIAAVHLGLASTALEGGRELGCGGWCREQEHLRHKLEDLSLRPQHPFKKSGMAASTYNPCILGGGGAEKEDCFLTTTAAKTEQASGPVRACLKGIRTRVMGKDTWCPSLVSVHAYTTCTYTQVHAHWSMHTHK